MRFVCFIFLCFGTSTKDPIQSLDWFYLSFSCYLRGLVDYMCFYGSSIIRCKTPFQDQSVFRLLDWILRYTLFHGFDTLGSHLREEGSLDYDEGLVRLQVQTNFDTIINRQQSSRRRSIRNRSPRPDMW
jgi:hypothetical protein